MKFTENDKKLLMEQGYDEKNIQQIKRAEKYTTYMLCEDVSSKGKKISAAKAVEVLGRKVYLSGIARSAFHWTAMSWKDETGPFVYFDSSRYFRPLKTTVETL